MTQELENRFALHGTDKVPPNDEAAGHEGLLGTELAGTDGREVGVGEVQDGVNDLGGVRITSIEGGQRRRQ